MRKYSKYLLITLLAFSYVMLQAQSKKDLRSNNVTKKTIYEYDYEDSNGDEIIEQIEKYNEQGEVIERIEYDNEGKFKKHESFKFDSLGNLIEENEFDNRGNLESRITYTYKDGLKTEKVYYDRANKMVKKKKYVYE